MSDDEHDDLTRGGLRRGMRMLSIPTQAAGRSVAGWGARLAGRDADRVRDDVHTANARHLFAVLGELKGGAMKVGQMWSMLEAVLPDDIAAPYRAELRKLQAAAPPMPASRVHAVMAAELGPDWRDLFTDFSGRAAAAASIGQVHRGIWKATGEPVAVKIQYPGAAEALRADLRMLERMSGMIAPMAGGFDVAAVAREAAARVGEEVDYAREAAAQEQAARGFDGDEEVLVPHVIHHTDHVLVSQWIDGVPLLSAESAPEQTRNRLGLAYARFLFRGPTVCGLLHADPHPGNFLLTPDGRLAVLDWGLADRLPDGLPTAMGRLLRVAADGDARAMTEGLRAEGFVTRDVDADALMEYLRPFVEPAAQPTFHFDRAWLSGQMRRIGADKRHERIVDALNLPPSYLLLDRVWISGVAVLSQLDCTAPFASILDDFLPGWHRD